jgi:Zn-dependent protease with chaperone function
VSADVLFRPHEAEQHDGITLPTPSRGAYLTLVVTLLVAGVFAGTFLSGTFLGQSWGRAQQACSAAAGPPPSTTEAFTAWAQTLTRCQVPVERARGACGLAGAVVALLIGVGLMFALAERAVRRGGPLPAPRSLQARADRLAAGMGLRRAARVAIASAQVRGPYTAGGPGRTTILVPAGLMRRPETEIDAVLRHELAHVGAGDATLVWFTRGVWWAMFPVLLVPLIITEARYRRSPTFHWGSVLSLVSDYAARAGLLLAVTAVLAYSVLRTREHEADLRVARSGSGNGLIRLLSGAAIGRAAWRQPFATHPLPERRVEVLNVPGLLAGPRQLDTVCLAVLLGTTWWAVRDLGHSLLAGTAFSGAGSLVAGVLTGILLAATLGLALVRQAMAGVTWPGRQRWQLICGFALGSVAGQVTSVALTAAGTWKGPWQRPVSLLLPSVLLIGAIGLSHVLALFWAEQARGRSVGPVVRLMIFLGNLAVFAAATWYGQDAQTLVDNLHLSAVSTLVVLSVSHAMTAAVLILAVTLTLGLMLARERPRHRLVPAVATVAVVTVAVLIGQWQVGSGSSSDSAGWLREVSLDWWVAAGAGAGCVIAALLLGGARALGRALVTGPATTVATASILFLIRNGSWADPEFGHPITAGVLYLKESLSILALGCFLAGMAAVCLSPGVTGWRQDARRAWWFPALSVLLAVVLTVVVLRSADTLIIS